MKSIFYLHTYYVCIYLCDRFTCTFRCTVSFPFLDSVFQWIVQHLKVGKAVDFMAKSVAKIIEARKMGHGQDAQVSLGTYCIAFGYLLCPLNPLITNDEYVYMRQILAYT